MITKETNIAFFFLLLSLILRGLPTCPLQQCLLNGVKKRHRCTVVGNPGGPWGFGQILLRGLLAVVRKCRRVPFLYFIAFLCDKFLELTPSLPLPHLRVHLWEKVSWRSNLGLLFLPFSQFFIFFIFLLLLLQIR